MIEDSATLEGESAIPLEGIALGVDHLEALVVFLLSAVHTYATWIRPHATLEAGTIASVARDTYLSAMTASAKIDPDAHRRRETATKQVHSAITIEDPDHLIVIHRVRSFGVAIVFEREVPLGLARAFAQRIIGTLEHDLPYVGEPKSVSIRSAPAYEPPAAAPAPTARASESAAKPAASSSSKSSPGMPRVSSAPIVNEAPWREAPSVRPPERVSAPPAPVPDAKSPESRVSSPAPPSAARSGTPKPTPVVAQNAADDDAGPDTGRSSPPDRFSHGPDTLARPGPTRVPDGSEDEVAPSSIQGRARRLIALLHGSSLEPHIVLTRLGLRTGLGIEPLMDPKSLNAEALMLIETAAEDMLGVDHDGLANLLQKSARGA